MKIKYCLAGVSGIPALLICFNLIVACQPKREPLQAERIEQLHQWLDTYRRTPAELVVETVNRGVPIVFIQDTVVRADTVDLIKALIPLFVDLGIQNIGIGFLTTSGQKRLDDYLNNGNITAEEALMAGNPTLGYEEYRDLLIYLKNFPLNLVAMGVRNGSIDREIASRLLYEENSVLWISREHAEDIPEPPPVEDKVGNSIERQMPVKITHFGPYRENFRWNGLVEYIQQQRDVRDGTFAFIPTELPFAEWDYPYDFKPNIVIITNLLYAGVTAIPDFIQQTDIARVANFFPGVNIRKENKGASNKMNRIVRKRAKGYVRILNKL